MSMGSLTRVSRHRKAEHDNLIGKIVTYRFTLTVLSALRHSGNENGATYQRLIDGVFNNQISRNLEVYVDDMVIKSDSKEDMLVDIQETFDKLRAINMKLNPRKCSFGIVEGPFLGHFITKQGIKANPSTILTDKPIKQILARPEKSGRISKWAIELGEHDIKLRGRNSVKGQILADFLAETPSAESKENEAKETMDKKEELENM
ncbi:reverse transcriptase domain-containing protein [Tanacetum coccineum]